MIRDTEILKHALMGYEERLREIDAQVERISQSVQNYQRHATAPMATSAPRKKRRALSAQSRANIVRAQKKRWAAWRREKKAA